MDDHHSGFSLIVLDYLKLQQLIWNFDWRLLYRPFAINSLILLMFPSDLNAIKSWLLACIDHFRCWNELGQLPITWNFLFSPKFICTSSLLHKEFS